MTLIATPDPNWKPIESAPKDRAITTKIWHGMDYWIVTARWVQHWRAWMDVNPNSSIGWKVGLDQKPAYWDAGRAALSAGGDGGTEI